MFVLEKYFCTGINIFVLEFTIHFRDVDYQFWFSNRVKMLSITLNGKNDHLFLSCFHDYLHNKVFLFLYWNKYFCTRKVFLY